MSSKIDIAEVADTLKTHKLEPAVVREIIEELNARAEAKEADKAEPTPRGKTQFVAVTIPATSQAWIFQIPEQAGPQTILDRINTAAHAFNASKKGRLLPVKSLAEAVESVPRRFWKDADGTVVKTKLPCVLISTTNKLTEAPTA